MRRQDGRIEPGQSLRGAISARAWNRAQDAADVVLGGRPALAGAAARYRSLPRLTIMLQSPGYYGEVRQFFNASIASSSLISPSSPPDDNTWQYSDDEKTLPAYGELYTSGTTPNQVPNQVLSQYDPAIAICVDNDSYEYAVSGFAITRVRVFNYLHRFARMTAPFTGSTSEQDEAAAGCLDSAFFGSVRIIGYAAILNGFLDFRHVSTYTLAWPNFEFRWAMVKL